MLCPQRMSWGPRLPEWMVWHVPKTGHMLMMMMMDDGAGWVMMMDDSDG